jgi:flagellar basal body rod protein FlgB
VLFEDSLREALADAQERGAFPTDALTGVRFRTVEENTLRYRVDNSSVDLDREMAAQAETALKMSAVISLMGKRIGMYKRAIGEGGI